MATDGQRERRLKRERSRRQRALPRIQRDAAAEVKRLLRAAERDLRSELAGAPTDYQAFALPAVQATVRTALETLGTELGRAAAAGQRNAWTAGIASVDAPVDAAFGLDRPEFRLAAFLPEVDTQQLFAMQTFLTTKMRDVTVAAADRINSDIGLAIVGSHGVADAVKGVSRTLGSSRSRALTVTRTELARAYSAAGQQRLGQASEILPGMKKQWRRSGKLKSRIEHDAVDGQLRDADEPFLVGGYELMHPVDPAGPPAQTINCGCQSLPWMETWDVLHQGKRPFTREEIAHDPRRGDIA